MAKRNVAYVKPQEPSFLTRLKEEAGYIEGDTIETKRQPLPALCDEDVADRDEEQPVVVVLKPGDLSAEEAEKIRIQHKEEEESLPANLDKRILFRVPTKAPVAVDTSQKRRHTEEDHSHKRNKLKKIKNASLLSFDQEEDDDES